jgi:predicted DNA-binding transcriptional regulator AlpA
MNFLRLKQVQARLGIRKSKLYDDYIRTGRLKLVRLGPRSVAVPEPELDALQAELIAERDAHTPKHRAK